jgi:NitT/TauT family transport system substrate-binding protein
VVDSPKVLCDGSPAIFLARGDRLRAGPFVAEQANIAVMDEPGLDQAVAKGMKVVLGFPKSYGPYAFSAVTARNDVDPDTAQRVVNGMEMVMRFMATNEAKGVSDAGPCCG